MAETYDIAAIRTYLSLNSDLSTLVDGRIFGVELPEGQAEGNPRKAVIINDGGNGIQDESYRSIAWTLKDVRCYGETVYESVRVYNAVKQILKQLTRTLVEPEDCEPMFLYSAVPVTGRFTSREPDTNWPVSFGTFNIMIGEN